MQRGDAWQTIVLLLLEEPLKIRSEIGFWTEMDLIMFDLKTEMAKMQGFGSGGRLGEGTKTKTPAGQIG